MNTFEKLTNYDTDDKAGSPPEGDPPQAGGQDNAKWTTDQQAEFDRRAAALKKAAAAEARKAVQTEYEAKRQAEQDEADKKRMADEGQYKDLAAKADNAKSAAEKRAEEAEQRAKALALQLAFGKSVNTLGIMFVNDQAAEDAFARLDLEVVGDDGSGMKKAIEKLQTERPYYFGQAQSHANTDAGQRGQKQTTQKTDDERQKEIIQRFNIRRPR